MDIGAIVDGYYGDTARTFPVGAIDEQARRLLDVTERSLMAGIHACQPGMRLYDIGAAVQKVVESAGFSVVREYVGHGIGQQMHEEPSVPNYGVAGKGPTLGRAWFSPSSPWSTRVGPRCDPLTTGGRW